MPGAGPAGAAAGWWAETGSGGGRSSGGGAKPPVGLAIVLLGSTIRLHSRQKYGALFAAGVFIPPQWGQRTCASTRSLLGRNRPPSYRGPAAELSNRSIRCVRSFTHCSESFCRATTSRR